MILLTLAVHIIHIILIVICLFVPIFSDNKLYLKSVLLFGIVTILSWDVFGECPLFKLYDLKFKENYKKWLESIKINNLRHNEIQDMLILIFSCIILYKL